MKDIKQTTEAATAVARLIRDGITAHSDGKITAFEALGLLGGNASSLLTAVRGSSEIPAELKDIDVQEFDELYFSVIQALEWEDDANARLVVGSVYDLLRQALLTTTTVREYIANKAA